MEIAVAFLIILIVLIGFALGDFFSDEKWLQRSNIRINSTKDCEFTLKLAAAIRKYKRDHKTYFGMSYESVAEEARESHEESPINSYIRDHYWHII